MAQTRKIEIVQVKNGFVVNFDDVTYVYENFDHLINTIAQRFNKCAPDETAILTKLATTKHCRLLKFMEYESKIGPLTIPPIDEQL